MKILKTYFLMCLVIAIPLIHGAARKEGGHMYSYLLRVAARGELETVKSLVDRGADLEAVNREGNTALLLATQEDHLDVVKFLVERRANIEAVNHDGDTALLIAVAENNLDIVKFLVSHGANKEKVNQDGDTPLTLAVRDGYFPIVTFLVDSDREFVNEKNAFMILGVLAKIQDIGLIERLAQWGFGIDLLNDQHETLLTQFVVNRDYETVRFLIEKNVNPYQVDKAGYNAFDYAQEDKEMIDILQKTSHEGQIKPLQEKSQDDIEKMVRRMQFIQRTSRDIDALTQQHGEQEEKKEAAEMPTVIGGGAQQMQTYAHLNTVLSPQEIASCGDNEEDVFRYGDLVKKKYGSVLEDPLVTKVLAQEKRALGQGKYVFYRAEPGKYRVYRDFTDALYRLVNLYSDKNPFVFNRFFKDATKEPTINEYIKPENARAHKIGPKKLNVLLSANLALFGNVCNDGESTWFYFKENYEAPTGAVEVANMFERIFDVYGFDKKYIPQLLAIQQGIMAQSATLQQIIVPRSIVDDVAMLSTHGYCFPWPEKVDEDSWDENAINYDFSLKPIQGRHTKISPILYKYKAGEIKIDDRWQARLLLNMLYGLNPKAGIEIYSYTRIPEDMLNDLQAKVNTITAQIFKDWLEKERQNPHVPASIQEEPLGGVLQHLGKETARRRQAGQAEAVLRPVPEQEIIKEQGAEWQEPMPAAVPRARKLWERPEDAARSVKAIRGVQ